MPARLQRLSDAEYAVVRERLRHGAAPADLRAMTKHLLAVLSEQAPGHSVEVRVPPYAAAQCIPGVRHTRGTPPAVVETDPETWIALATGELAWAEAVDAGRVVASGERSDLSPWLPLADG
ncbi:MAG TPA: sterol carrier family protein [Nocardioidaceae bacterium]|nr:sterol carrier family protein [Nocardioidaceae bacterium]